jgi:hypothetical protein
VVCIIPTRTGELNSHQPKSPMREEGVHTTGCCPVPRRDHLRHCCHHLSATQLSAQYFIPLLGPYRPPRRGRLGLDFGGGKCACTYMCVCVCVCVYIYIYIHIGLYIHTYLHRLHTCVPTYILRTYIHIYLRT